MKILVTEQLPGGATDVACRLSAVGHEITYCHALGQSSAQCVGTSTGGRCPLADPDVAVAVDVRTHEGPLTVREFLGAMCAVRNGTPLVVCGPVSDRRLAPWSDADITCDPEQVVDACTAAASAVGATAHRAVVTAVARVARQMTGHRELAVSLRERRGTIDVEITTARRVQPQVCQAIRTVVRGTLSRYTPNWSYADVRFRTPLYV
jgi:hypothetical protein